MDNYHETIIIGAGPGGLIAGINLKDNFLILDKKKEIGIPVQCGEGISKKALEMQGIAPNQEWVSSKINIVERVMPNGKSFGTYHDEPSGYVIDRSIFEKKLAEKIKDKIILGKEVVKIEKEGENWLLETSDGEKFNCKYIIGADGVNSVVRRLVFPENKDNIGFFSGIEYLVKTEKEIDSNRIKMYFDNKKYNRGYAWIFPKSINTANIGLCGKNIRMSDFDDFMQSKVKEVCGNYELIKNKSGVIPIAEKESIISKDNVMLVGDAAGFADPFFKGGMSQSMLSAKIAAECIKENRAGEYNKVMNDVPFMNRGVFETSEIFYNFDNEVFNEIGDILEGKSFSYLKTIKGQNELMSKPHLSRNINNLLKFFDVWQKTSDYLW